MAAHELYFTTLFNDANLVSYYRFENSLNDEKGNNTLTNTGSTDTISGQFGHGRAFASASSQYTKKTSMVSQPTGNAAFTMHCWMQFSTDATIRVIMAMGVDGVSTTVTGLYVNTDGKIHFEGGSGTNTCTDTTVRSTGTWYMVTATYDGAGTAKLYINGSLITTTNSLTYGLSAGDLNIGSWVNNTLSFDGIIDDVAIFNRALSATEISNLYNGLLGSSSQSPSASISPSASQSPSASISPSASQSPSASISPSSSLSPSSSISSSLSPSSSVSPSSSLSPSASVSPSSSVSASPSFGYAFYSRGAYISLPINDNDLSILYSEQEAQKTTHESDVILDIEDDIGQDGVLDYMVHQFKNFVGDLTSCGVLIRCESTLATILSPVYLQIYNQTTHTWDILDSNNTYMANVTFELRKDNIDLTNYKVNQIISCRVYQLAI